MIFMPRDYWFWVNFTCVAGNFFICIFNIHPFNWGWKKEEQTKQLKYTLGMDMNDSSSAAWEKLRPLVHYVCLICIRHFPIINLLMTSPGALVTTGHSASIALNRMIGHYTTPVTESEVRLVCWPETIHSDRRLLSWSSSQTWSFDLVIYWV